jgi:S1-C subfamily serine protease
MVVRLTLEGYAAKEIQLTEGPMIWVSTLKGHNHGNYWLLKTDHFQVELQSASQTFTGAVESVSGSTLVPGLRPELSLEELVSRTKPAVVFLKSLTKSGTGFFVTATGVIATNDHLAPGEEALLATLPNGTQLEAKIVYVDPDLDIALAKTSGESFPHLPLAEAATVRQGENVLAIGNPGDAMLFSVTKGIVSAVGRFDAAGPGTWIQTDAPINPGNSGGPLDQEKCDRHRLCPQRLRPPGSSSPFLSVGPTTERKCRGICKCEIAIGRFNDEHRCQYAKRSRIRSH